MQGPFPSLRSIDTGGHIRRAIDPAERYQDHALAFGMRLDISAFRRVRDGQSGDSLTDSIERA